MTGATQNSKECYTNAMSKYILYSALLLLLGGIVTYILWPKTQLPPTTQENPYGTSEDITPQVTSELEQRVRPLLEQAEVRIPEYETPVQLKNGSATFEAGTPDYHATGTLSLEPIFAVNETTNDVFATFTINYGGSGNFVRLILFELRGNTLVQKEFDGLGDRVEVTSINFDAGSTSAVYDVRINLLTRAFDEPLSAEVRYPSTRNYTVSNHQFIQK